MFTHLWLSVEAEGERGQHDRDGRQRHRQPGQRGGQPDVQERVQHPGGDRHPAEVVQHREHEVQPDAAEHLEEEEKKEDSDQIR